MVYIGSSRILATLREGTRTLHLHVKIEKKHAPFFIFYIDRVFHDDYKNIQIYIDIFI